MEATNAFDNIRSYSDDEMPRIVELLLGDPEFRRIIESVMPSVTWEDFSKKFRSYKNVAAFQADMISEFIFDLVGKSSAETDCSGLENVTPGTAYTFISNHRDIVLDSALLCVLLCKYGRETTEIAIGDNLLSYPWIERFVRLNRSFIVRRGVSGRQMLENSALMSKYIHAVVEKENKSVWIAQREGRAKDSNDRTQESVLKMLAMGGNGNFLTSIKSLNICPLSLSYEYDPCDYLKAREFQQKRDNPEFKKAEKEDLFNMKTGLFGYKGRIHFQFGKAINPKIEKMDVALSRNEQSAQVAHWIDTEIYRNYTLYPGNYIAYDRLWGHGICSDKYTDDDCEVFDIYLDKQLSKIILPNKDIPFLTEKFLEMYGYPVKNQLLADDAVK
ncbi:acyltransferase [Bacteroidia bacterium]|nr:acyltransferase [Bacteroidia bacterium]